MNRNNSVFCRHCHEDVSQSTYRRHMVEALRQNNYSSSTDFVDNNIMGNDSEANEMAEAPDTDIERESDDELNSCDGSHYSDNSSDNENTSDSGDEYWDDILPEEFQKDILPPCLPEPQQKKRRMQKVTSLLQWLVYFLLIWQTSCKISDNGLLWLLRFMFKFFQVIGIEVEDEFLCNLISSFPTSLHLLWKCLNLDRDDFHKYVVCPACTKLYNYDACLESVNGRIVSKTCSNMISKRGRLTTCGSKLTKKVLLSGGKEQFYPLYYYCFNSIINSLESILQRKGVPESCELWRNRNIAGDLMTDVYDGQLWKEFMSYNGVDFLNKSRNYGLMLNFDYFQPMKHRKDYSVGVLYLVLLNLPRSERFKWENVIVVGVIPSMEKEPKHLNEFVLPVVSELKFLWNGVRLKSSLTSIISLTFRAALLCTSSDIPAARKICGIKSHSGQIGCSHCYKKFPGAFGEKRDYSGFDRENWRPRTHAQHKRNCDKMSKCKTKSAKEKLGTEYGISHYSALLDLEYFDVIRFCTIDPMHNLFLGTAKKMFKIWIDNDILTKKKLKDLEAQIELMEVPSNIGRLPTKITSNHGSYTAEQWKNWTLIYSMFVLKDILEEKHLNCWQTFVLACKYLCKPVVSICDVTKADLLFLKFGKSVENVYGNLAVTPNMHLHCHLKEIIIDHGPITSFWCFSFERYNGIMGSTITNNRSLEVQLMRRLTVSRFLSNFKVPDEYTELEEVVKQTKDDQSKIDRTVTVQQLYNFFTIASLPLSLAAIDWSDWSSAVTLPPHYKSTHVSDEDLLILSHTYKVLFPDSQICTQNLSSTMQTYGSITIGQDNFGSTFKCRMARSSGIYAAWSGANGEIDLTSVGCCAGQVQFYFKHSINNAGKYMEVVFSCVRWCRPYGDNNIPNVSPLEMYKFKEYKPGGPSSFIPVQRITSKCAFATTKFRNETVTMACPINRTFSM